MNDSAPHDPEASTHVLGLAAGIARAETVESAVGGTIDIALTALNQPAVGVYEHDPATGAVSTVGASADLEERDVSDRLAESVIERLSEREEPVPAESLPEASVNADAEEPLTAEVLVPAGRRWLLRLATTTPDGFDETDVTAAENLAGLLGTALTRIDGQHQTTTAAVTRSLFEQSTEATFISEADGTVVAVNDAAAELADRERATLPGTDLTAVLVDGVGSARPSTKDAVATSDRGSGTLQRPDGTTVAVEFERRQVEVEGTTYVRTTARKRDTTPADQSEQESSTDARGPDAATLRRLYKLTVTSDDFEETVERLLSLGRDHFGLDTGILACIEGTEYEIEAVVDSTGLYEPGATFDLSQTLCEVTLTADQSEPLAFADVAATEHREHPASSAISAYIAAPVVVDGETFGTVNFSMQSARAEPFRPEELEFVKLVAQWVGFEIERRRRFEELERYETILEAVGDPVYALDAEGRFTFVNEAAKQQFGHGTEVIGKTPAVGMQDSDIERVREQIEELLGTDQRSTTAEFELKAADGSQRTVENRLALIGDDEFNGTAGVIRDITAREERRRKLEQFQRAIEEAADGIAVLDGDEYTYVDQSHVDMYGFEDKAQLLGNTWRALYGKAEVERLEAEAFPALESEGYWRGMVTGSRPDGSTFPAELSLTIVEDGRLVCTVRDETERRERERELELKERAMDEAEVGIQITDPTQEDNPLVYVNDGFARMTGYSREEALGRNLQFLQGPESDPERTAQLREAIDAEEPVSVELRNYRKDGTPYWARLSITPVTDERGAVRNYIGIQQDVTERRERSQWLRQFLNRGPLMFIETRQVDGEAVVDSCNQRFLERLGYDRDEIEGEPLAALYTPESAADLQEGGYEDALTGEFEMSERTLVDADGEPVHTLLRAVPRRDETAGTNALFVDISERKERERQNQAKVDIIRSIYEVTTNPDLTLEQKVSGLLEAGREELDLPYGYLARIDPGDESSADTQTIVEGSGSHDGLQSGETGPVGESYCRRALQTDGLMTLTNASESGWADDPAYETFGLETYIGGEVAASDGQRWTLCFASKEPREQSFDAFEESFIKLVGQWVSYEIDRRNTRRELRQQREKLELTLSETDTGIAEWDLRTDEVAWNETFVEMIGREVESIEAFEAAVHPEDRGRVRERLKTMTETGEPWVGEFRMFDDEGAVRWLGTRAIPTYDEGTPVQVLATVTDVTDQKDREAERRRNERRFQSLFEDPEMLVGLLDTDGTLLAANETGLAYIDETADEVRGEPFWETPWWTHSEELQADLQEWVQRAAEGEYVDYEATHPGPDGDVRRVEGTIRPVANVSGSVESLVISAHDVTQRERQQRELADRQRKLDLVLSNTDTSVAELDLESGTVHWDDMVGDNDIGSPETLGDFYEAVHRDDRDRLQSDLGAMMETQEPLSGEYRILNEDGEVMWIAAEAVPTSRELDDDSSSGKVVAIATDITELKGRERALEESQERYRTLLRAAPDPVFVADAETGDIIEANTAAEALLGQPRDEIIGRNQTDLHPEGDGDLYRAAFEQSLGRSTMVSELPDGTQPMLRTADGEEVPIEINADTVELPEGPVIYGVFRDISKRREREESLRVSEQRYRRLAENIPNGAVITFDADFEYRLAAGELLGEFGLDSSDITGRTVGTVLADGEHELLPRFQAALEGERTDRRVELQDRTLRIHIVPTDQNGGGSADAIGLLLAQDVTAEARREQELFEERERFRLLTESVDEYAFLVVGADGAVQTWNESAETLFGYDAETAVGKPIAEFHPEDERESGVADRLLQQARVSGESAHEGWRVRADGSKFYADVRYAPLESDDGTFRGYAKIVRDMTDRRRQKRRTETFVEESEDVVTIVDTDGSITYASGSAERVLGYAPEDLVGDNLFDYLHPDGREGAMETFFSGMENPDANLEAECRLKSADGEWLNVEGQCRNKLDDDAIDGMLLYLRDVTERKSQARRFESIFNQTYQFTGLLEPDGTVVEVNDATLKFAGIQRDDLVGESLLDAPWWAHSEALRERARSALERAADGEFVRYETEARGVDGLATIDFSVKPVTDEDGAVTLLVAEGRDITRIQQQKRHLGVMQRVMRHNMRNDLMKMRGWTEAMRDEPDDEKRAEHYETIEGILDKWTSMTRKMKQIRNVMETQKEGQRIARPIREALEEAAAPSRETHPEATIRIDAPCDDDVQVPLSLTDAVGELIGNAAEATDAGTIVVESARPDNDWLEVTVRDDGPGMPEMEAEVLQTGEETQMNHGQSLGLWMVRMVVTQAGGEVMVETGADGTAVVLRLPMSPVDSTAQGGRMVK